MENEIVINLTTLKDDANNYTDFDIFFLNCSRHKKFSLNQIEFLDLLNDPA